MQQPAGHAESGAYFGAPAVFESVIDGIALALGEHVPDPHYAAKSFSTKSLAAAVGARLSKGSYSSSDPRAINFGMGTSDFSGLLAEGLTPLVRRLYRAQARHTGFCAVVNVRDFRPYAAPRYDFATELGPVGENAEVQTGSITREAGATTVKVTRCARALAISRATIINNEIDLIAETIRSVGPTVAAQEAGLVAAVLESPGNLDDGAAVFGDSNTVAEALSETSLSDAITKLLKHPTPNGGVADLDLRSLVVAPGLVMTARKLVRDYALDDVTVTPLGGLAAGRWYALASPELSPTIAVVRMAGVTDPVRIEGHRPPKGADGSAMLASAELGVAMLGRIGIVRGGA